MLRSEERVRVVRRRDESWLEKRHGDRPSSQGMHDSTSEFLDYYSINRTEPPYSETSIIVLTARAKDRSETRR